jgi:hypothetical protein
MLAEIKIKNEVSAGQSRSVNRMDIQSLYKVRKNGGFWACLNIYYIPPNQIH